MKKERKELMKKFNVVVEDLLDNFDKYTEEEKQQVRDVFNKVAELNKVLDKYDVETKITWMDYVESMNEYFDVLYRGQI
jgi:predicted methyltransferase